MKKKMMGVMTIMALMFSFSFVVADVGSDDDTMTVKVDVLKSRIGISVPEEVRFHEIAAGYLSEREDLDIENIGTVDIEVSAELAPGYNGTIFQNLAFRRILTDDLVGINIFDFEILKPNVVGGTRSENVYMYLDLENYSGDDIEDDMLDHEADVVFYALAM
jgi:hypothetical protein